MPGQADCLDRAGPLTWDGGRLPGRDRVDLDGRQELQPGRQGRDGGPWELPVAGERVVICDCQEVHADSRSVVRQPCGAEDTVRSVSVGVEIDRGPGSTSGL